MWAKWYYPTAIHLQPIYKSLASKAGELLETERVAAEMLLN